jgi:hypothetical protein
MQLTVAIQGKVDHDSWLIAAAALGPVVPSGDMRYYCDVMEVCP